MVSLLLAHCRKILRLRLIRFWMVGGVGTITQYSVVWCMHPLGLPVLADNKVGIFLATQLGFALSYRVVWKDRVCGKQLSISRLALMWAMYTGTGLFSSLPQDGVYTLLTHLGMEWILALLIGGAASGLAVFIADNFVTFNFLVKFRNRFSGGYDCQPDHPRTASTCQSSFRPTQKLGAFARTLGR